MAEGAPKDEGAPQSAVRPTQGEGAPAPSPAHKLWGGRFSGETAAAFDAINHSIGTDIRLWPYDVRLSKAWAVALWNAGVLTLAESDTIVAGLEAVEHRLSAGERPTPGDEDVHTLVDRLLHEEVGEVASKLHTGRSRNDQVATATRLWALDACAALDEAVRTLEGVLVERAEELGEALMPAYTHLQRAQPVLAAHWLLSHLWPLERDRARLAHAARAASVLPLGSGAIAGCAFPVPRVLLQGALGFAELSPNSIDAVGDRDFVADLLYAVTVLGTHLSRLGEDLVLYASSEFGFVRFSDAFSSGSSLMPQKRNPDAMELARGGGGRALGHLVSVLTTLKGLPSGYNKDLQDDKRPLFDAVDAMLRLLPAVAGAVHEASFDTARMEAAISSPMMATDLADYLVAKGVPFRDAHAAVGRLVAEAERLGRDLAALPMSVLLEAHPRFGEDALDALAAARSVARRAVQGGTAPAAMAEQLELARAAVKRRVS